MNEETSTLLTKMLGAVCFNSQHTSASICCSFSTCFLLSYFLRVVGHGYPGEESLSRVTMLSLLSHHYPKGRIRSRILVELHNMQLWVLSYHPLAGKDEPWGGSDAKNASAVSMRAPLFCRVMGILPSFLVCLVPVLDFRWCVLIFLVSEEIPIGVYSPV